MQNQDIKTLIKEIKSGNITVLSKMITALESTQDKIRKPALEVLNELLSETGRALRIGISGPPGAGKSTLIEELGLLWSEQGFKLAILTIDPSSDTTGGSILGDKTRMQNLSVRPNTYIRPSPAKGFLGGVTSTTQESLLLCEAAGYDLIIIETIGVGQSEISVSNMVDCFLAVLSPASGDELQALKKGLIERADIIVINKTDGNLEKSALETASHYRSALNIMSPVSKHWTPSVLNASALKQTGLTEIQNTLTDYQTLMKQQNLFERKRETQRAYWFEKSIEELLLKRFYLQPELRAHYHQLKSRIVKNQILPGYAAHQLLTPVSSEES